MPNLTCALFYVTFFVSGFSGFMSEYGDYNKEAVTDRNYTVME